MDLEKHIEGLTELLEVETAMVATAKQHLYEAQEREKRISRALDALTGAQRPAATAKPVKAKKAAWVPSEAALSKVLNALAGEDGDGMFLGSIATITGQSTGTVSRCIEVLRERGDVRAAGAVKGARGAPRTLFKLDNVGVDNNGSERVE